MGLSEIRVQQTASMGIAKQFGESCTIQDAWALFPPPNSTECVTPSSLQHPHLQEQQGHCCCPINTDNKGRVQRHKFTFWLIFTFLTTCAQCMGHPALLISARLFWCHEHPNPSGVGQHPKPSNTATCNRPRCLHCTAIQPPPSARAPELPFPGNPASPRAVCAAPEQPKKSRRKQHPRHRAAPAAPAGPERSASGNGTWEIQWKEIPENTDAG